MKMFCSLFGYTKQAYYKYRAGRHHWVIKEQQVKQAVLQIRRIMPRIGTRKLHFMLKEQFQSAQIKVGRDKLFTLLRNDGLLIVKRKKYMVTTNSKHWMHKYPNLIKELDVARPEQLWVADITYLDTLEANSYLHLITDAYSKQIMGYQLSNDMEAGSTLKALQMAISNRQYPWQPLIHHSDRGLQYCSKLYVNHLLKNNIQISMTENGDPYENAVAERMNGILKDEFGLGEKLGDLQEALHQTRQSIRIYNHLRPHQSCHYLTPLQVHQQQTITIKTWKKKTAKVESTLAVP
jgi:transposase InsO family protein